MQAIVTEDHTAGPPANGLLLVPGRNLVTGVKELNGQLGQLTSLEADLLTLAASIFALDLAAKRGEREEFTRDLRLSIPVVNYHILSRYAEDIASILYFLSDDNWTIEFGRKNGLSDSLGWWPTRPGRTLLFSGGLDSLAAAVQELERGEALQLVSHYTRNRITQTSQADLFDYLCDGFGSQVSRVSARVSGQQSGKLAFPSDSERESTQRTRSFLFLVLAAIASRRAGFHEVLMIAENGQMAIHLPLTAGRIGAFSTHTAHPQFVSEMEKFLSATLSFQFQIRNPFLYMTKGECVEGLVARHLPVVKQAVSCWKSSRQALPHCGECIPCLIRRIAIESNGVYLREYTRDLLEEDVAMLPPHDTGAVNLVELGEFIHWFGGPYPDSRIEQLFPDLINEHFDRAKAIGMYRRFAQEARTVLTRYPKVKSILR